MIVLALLVAQLPGEQLDAQIADLTARVAVLESRSAPPGVFYAADWIPDGGDIADAIDRIQRDPACGPLNPDASRPDYRDGCRIMLPRGEYRTKTINVCRQLIIEGTSGTGWGAATVLRTDGQTGIRVRTAAWCLAAGYAPPTATGGTVPAGGWSILRHFQLVDAALTSTTTPIYSAGVVLDERATLEDLWIRGYTHGVRIDAGAKRTETSTVGWETVAATNANLWRIRDVSITGTRHTGLFIDGPDSNAGYSIGLDVTGACTHGSTYVALGFGPCASIHDSSFLGNTHVAPHTADAIDVDGVLHHQVLTDSDNARNVWIGVYAEVGHGPARASNRDLVLGGSAAWDPTGQGMRIQDSQVNGFCSGGLCAGDRAGGGALALQADGWGTLRVKPALVAGQPVWRWDLNNLGSAQAFWIVAASGPLGDPGDVLFRRRLLLPECVSPEPIMLAGLGLEPSGAELGICR